MLNQEKEKNLIRRKFLQNHNGGFKCLAISNDGRILVTGSDDTTVRVWDCYDKRSIVCYDAHTSSVYSVAINRDSSFAVSGSMDKSVIMWDLRRHLIRCVFDGHYGGVFCVGFSLYENFVVSGCLKGEFRIWNVKDKSLFKMFKVDGPVYCLAVSQINELFLGSSNRLIKWDLNSFQLITSIQAHKSSIKSITLTKLCKFVITSSNDHIINIWILPSLRFHKSLIGHQAAITAISITADDRQLVSIANDKKIIIFSMIQLSKIYEFYIKADFIYDLKCIGDWIITASCEGRIGFTRLSTRMTSHLISLKTFEVSGSHEAGNLIAYYNQNNIFVWESDKEEIKLEGHMNPVKAVCFFPSMTKLISASAGFKLNLIIWNINSKSIVKILDGHKNTVNCVHVSNDELNAVSGSIDSIVIYWDLATMTKVAEFKGHQGVIFAVKISNNKSFAVSTGEDKKVVVWDITKKCRFAVFGNHLDYVFKLWICEDNEFVVSADFSDGIRVWSALHQREIFNDENKSELKEWLDNNMVLKNQFSRFIF